MFGYWSDALDAVFSVQNTRPEAGSQGFDDSRVRAAGSCQGRPALHAIETRTNGSNKVKKEVDLGRSRIVYS